MDELRRAAGWYPDPDIAGTERWWNGSSFSDHVRLAPEPAPPHQLPPLDESPPLNTPSHPPGWYPDPAGSGAPRWWNGSSWTQHSAAPAPFTGYPAPSPYVSTTVVTVTPPKSVGVAFLLTFLFGPLGMLYSTVTGAFVMIAVAVFGGFLVGLLTFGVGWLVRAPAVWLTSIVWGCVAASNHTGTQVVTQARY